ncbi:4'-phosphopantetheinyl transferase family protein [Pacificoceanicola onchidii]|uniref:4'-phosphopantetheinyl transferase family protein n=1 Tax=Pacificoceanicola onchidii TaxID=2562685 RepID=UPI00145624DC|nr:4'-phosphopantetheinyl transferase superfamily protein [Pacificoceanicola onchidii]
MTVPDLPALTDGFLTMPEQRPLWGGTRLTARFDLARYHRDLFDALDITFPERLSRAVDKRRAEYLAGRTLARLAQESLGHAPAQIPSADSRAPLWPDHLTGSISHARGHVACLLLPAAEGHPGIDIEAIATGSALEAITKTALCGVDGDHLTAAPLPYSQAATLLFSAKETLFKALHPTVQRFFGFTAATLTAPPAGQTLTLELTEDLHQTLPSGTRFAVHYEIAPDRVLTWMRA